MRLRLIKPYGNLNTGAVVYVDDATALYLVETKKAIEDKSIDIAEVKTIGAETNNSSS